MKCQPANLAKTYSIVVNAFDGTTTRPTTLNIEVEDANDSAPILTKAVANARGAVRENVAGADTGITLRLTDADSAGVMTSPLTSLALMPWINLHCFGWLRMRGCAIETRGRGNAGL